MTSPQKINRRGFPNILVSSLKYLGAELNSISWLTSLHKKKPVPFDHNQLVLQKWAQVKIDVKGNRIFSFYNFPKLRTTLQGMPKLPNLYSRKFQFRVINFLKLLEFLKVLVKLKVPKFSCLGPQQLPLNWKSCLFVVK